MEERTTVEKVIGGINSLIGLVIFAFFIAGKFNHCWIAFWIQKHESTAGGKHY